MNKFFLGFERICNPLALRWGFQIPFSLLTDYKSVRTVVYLRAGGFGNPPELLVLLMSAGTAAVAAVVAVAVATTVTVAATMTAIAMTARTIATRTRAVATFLLFIAFRLGEQGTVR